MFQGFSKIEKLSGQLAITTGKLLLLVFSAAILINALLRYLFSFGHVAMIDLAQYSFSVLVLIAIFVAFVNGKHVRVRSEIRAMKRAKSRMQNSFDRGLLPALVFFMLAALSIPGVIRSWGLLEGSAEPGGLGGYFLIKSILPLVLIMVGLLLWKSPQTHDDRN